MHGCSPALGACSRTTAACPGCNGTTGGRRHDRVPLRREAIPLHALRPTQVGLRRLAIRTVDVQVLRQNQPRTSGLTFLLVLRCCSQKPPYDVTLSLIGILTLPVTLTQNQP